MQSTTIAKVRETFVLIRSVIGEFLSEVVGQVSHGLVLDWFKSCVLRLVFLDSSLQSPGQEKHFGILFIPLRVVVRQIQLSVQTCPKRKWPTLAWFSALLIVFCSSTDILS